MGKWKRKLSLPRRWQRNHLIAKLSKGGTDTIDNYRLAHFECNQLKSDLTPEEFREFQLGKIQWEA